MLSPWIPYVLFAAVILIGVPLWRLLAGDDEPDNAVAHESSDDRERDPEPPLLAATA